MSFSSVESSVGDTENKVYGEIGGGRIPVLLTTSRHFLRRTVRSGWYAAPRRVTRRSRMFSSFFFFAICAFLAALHSQSCFRCELSVPLFFPSFHTLGIGHKKLRRLKG
jgi:hypothetical protein